MTPRCRFRDLGLRLGRFEPGVFNAITDVAGVRVGHATIRSADQRVHTGVTAVLPNDGNIFMERMLGGAFVLNGAGEMSGLIQVQEWGLLETPILLTNTLSVGSVSDGVVKYLLRRYPGIGRDHDVIIPLVGECDDSFLNDIQLRTIDEHHITQAMDGASTGPVAEGSVGGGAGMVAFDLKSGIGTSSRVIPIPAENPAHDPLRYTVGVLVMSNVGRLEDLRVDGVPVGEEINRLFTEERRRSLYGSVIAVVATNAPLIPFQLNRLAKRVALGLGRTGSYAAHGSGEIIIAFSTANRVPRRAPAPTYTLEVLGDRHMDPLYIAAIEATEEAVLNALCVADATVGIDGHVAPALPLDALVSVMARHGRGPSGPTRAAG